MKRILFVIDSLFPLGPASQLMPLVRELADRDLACHVAVLDRRSIDSPDTGAAVHALSTQVSVSPGPLSRQSLASVLSLRKLLAELQVDIVHAWGGLSEWVVLAATEYGGYGSLHRFGTRLNLAGEKRFGRQIVEQRFSRGFDTVMVSHDSIRQSLVDEGVPTAQVVVIPHGLPQSNSGASPISDSRAQIRKLLKLPAETKLAGVVAPLVPRSRLKDLIWATYILGCVRDDIHLVIFGDGEQRRRLAKFARQAETRTHVHFLGQPRGAEQLFAGIDFFWHSHLMEPNPSSMMLAMDRQIPVISVLGPETSDLVRHQVTGLAVNYGARDEFARWTKYLIDLPDASSQLAEQGRQHLRQHFVASPVESYLACYRACGVKI